MNFNTEWEKRRLTTPREVLFPAAVFLVRGETRRVRALAQGLADGLAGRAGARWPGKGG